MKFYPLTGSTEVKDLTAEYKASHTIGVLHIGEAHLFFRKQFRTYYIPFSEIHRIFRRVMLVPAKMCCANGELQVENLVICDMDDKEIAQLQLPGAKAAKLLMEELQHKMKHVIFAKPLK